MNNYDSEIYDAIVLCCIGTDRSTGDSLAPIIGYKLNSFNNNIYIYGTLDDPLHAKNLKDTMDKINRRFDNPFIIAVDACLGKMDHVGYISIGKGSINPESGLGKDLPAVGNVYITGIVNYGGFMDFIVLQNTRLSLVMKIADIISLGIKLVLPEIIKNENNKLYEVECACST
jgi:putative sporulation protein YyaC